MSWYFRGVPEVWLPVLAPPEVILKVKEVNVPRVAEASQVERIVLSEVAEAFTMKRRPYITNIGVIGQALSILC